jgi:hypothetical protein
MTLSRVGEIDPNVAVVPPETIPARVDTPPIALISGIYDVTITYTATPDVLNPPPPDKIRQRYDTICVRLGDRCAATTQADPRAIFSPLLVLEGGAWRSDYNIPYPCNVGSNEPHTNATFHWELFQSDAGPNPTEFLTGTWVRDKADPCPATSRATVEMQRVSSVGHQPGAFGPAVSQG